MPAITLHLLATAYDASIFSVPSSAYPSRFVERLNFLACADHAEIRKMEIKVRSTYLLILLVSIPSEYLFYFVSLSRICCH